MCVNANVLNFPDIETQSLEPCLESGHSAMLKTSLPRFCTMASSHVDTSTTLSAMHLFTHIGS